jgi:protein-tyrosine phosphatase
MENILVLCIGNICRSPMAEAMLKQALPSKNIYSAGLGALIGKPADPFSVELMAEQGIDITAHRAQQISPHLVSQSDLILVMDREQKRHVETHYFGARGKVFRLCDALKVDVHDPYREGVESFRVAQELIADGVKFWAEQITKMS